MMENLTHPLTIVFIIIWIIEFYLFGMQRASLIISRLNKVEWRGIGERLLPNWFPLTWVVRFAKYGVLLAILFMINWKWAVGLFVGEFILSIITSIPYQLFYSKVFRNRVVKIKREDVDAGQVFCEMLDDAGY